MNRISMTWSAGMCKWLMCTPVWFAGDGISIPAGYSVCCSYFVAPSTVLSSICVVTTRYEELSSLCKSILVEVVMWYYLALYSWLRHVRRAYILVFPFVLQVVRSCGIIQEPQTVWPLLSAPCRVTGFIIQQVIKLYWGNFGSDKKFCWICWKKVNIHSLEATFLPFKI